MVRKHTPMDSEKVDRIIAEARAEKARREKTYRERALKIFPWICARCGREFSGKRLRELTVHHKDHNHDNNPLDGSNWELLCLFCHDNEHSRYLDQEGPDEPAPGSDRKPATSFKPFAALDSLLKEKK
ncbi:MAG: HNH nuclease family protein [Deltaproteobacteria bacterium]|jgi:5-methylcytosine-specific restriction endonuclease McrA|nr:HNH nuclease family protein [Deltaproteobacteria bacterium]